MPTQGERPPVLLYVDLDEFFVQVERLAAPGLAARPVLVGGLQGQRGEVACASLEARKFGIRAGMSLREALARCPEAVVLPCDPPRIHDLSRRFFQVLLRWSPSLERRSLDEAWLDIRHHATGLSKGIAVARSIQEVIRFELGMTASAGVGKSGTIAHRACEAAKPGGTLSWDHNAYAEWSRSAGIEELPGVGEILAPQLKKAGIRTVADLARCDEEWLIARLGSRARALLARARGEDPRPLIPMVHEPRPRTFTRTLTFPRPLVLQVHVERVLLVLAEEIARDLRLEGGKAERITLTLALEEGGMERRGERLPAATTSSEAISRILRRISAGIAMGRGVRSVTIAIGRSDRAGCQQEDLFGNDQAQWDRASDRIIERFGRRSFVRASMLPLSKVDR